MNNTKITLQKKPKYIKFSEDEDFFELFQKINSVVDTCYFLESLDADGDKSRYSVIGFEPETLIRGDQNFKYADLSKIMPEGVISEDYAGGLVGYLGFDAFAEFEPKVKIKSHPHFDKFLFGVYTDGLVYDKTTGESYYFYYKKNRLKFIEKISKNSLPKEKKLRVVQKGATMTKNQHKISVKEVKKLIKEGKIFQCVVGFKEEYEIIGEALEIYKKLRKINPSPHMYYLKFGKQKLIGASPELLFRLKDGTMETYPLAGTVKRGKNASEDRKFARDLLSDQKELAEHRMLVDLHRNDIGRIARFNTVRVNKLMDVKKFSHVQHISSEISGMLKPGIDMFSAVASNFPAGTLTGAPKIEAIKILEKIEKVPRGPYGGAVGHFGFNGNCTFTIPIRSLFISGKYGFIQAGSGIVADSEAEKEYDEVRQKLKAMDEALAI